MNKRVLFVLLFFVTSCPSQINKQDVNVAVNIGDEIKEILKGVKETPSPSPTITANPVDSEIEPTTLTNAGYSLKFKGSNSYASVTSSSVLNLKNSFTLQSWIKINNYSKNSEGDYFPILNKGSKDIRYGVSIKNPSTIEVKMNNQKVLIKDSGEYYPKTWYNISVTWDGKDIYVYKNGNLTGQSEYNVNSLITGETGTLYIGADLSNVEKYADGEIDDLRIWDKALTEREIKSNMHFKLKGNENNLVLYFPFDEGKDEIASDITSSKINASIINLDKWRISNAPIY